MKWESHVEHYDKEWTYIRDVLWPNLRKSTMAKIDNAKKTGTGGGKEAKLNEIDHKVLDIIGKESPTIVSLNVPETFKAELPKQCSSLTPQPSCSNEGSSDTTCESSTRIPYVQMYMKRKRAEEEVKIYDQLKKCKIELQLEFLK